MGMERTLYFCRSSSDSGEDMIFLRTCEGALKRRLRVLLPSEVTQGLNFMLTVCKERRGKEGRVLGWVPGPAFHPGHSSPSLHKGSTGGGGLVRRWLREENGGSEGSGCNTE